MGRTAAVNSRLPSGWLSSDGMFACRPRLAYWYGEVQH